ncbi:RNA polymerase sigma-70 factor [Proteiniphilum sp.]|uniref:RNA polymerase sigma-70 factor n=1 Tax=Proteiniphilum sp. TaxID=1926877 RepID=UPI002B201AB5|nr:RNA polymerase sigma-70 factor [Proteiniphilum sp.]MEA4919244.1 RNA polymerase sigma-70 factor [Proteiniphilum sp.]
MERSFNPNSFAELYAAYYQKCFLFTKSYVHDRFVAEDIASEVLIKLYEVIRNEEINNVSAYLLTLLKNRSLDYLKNLATRKRAYDYLSELGNEELNFRIASLEECDPNIIFSKEIERIIEQTLMQLSSQTREIFMLSRYENLSNKEIALQCDMSVKNVEYHISKALKSLRLSLSDYLPYAIILFFF